MNVAFYSYKGGVGRTQLVANLASYLYHYENKRVLLMDWDLEAPGLNFYFKHGYADFTQNGLMEVLEDYVRLVRQRNPEEITEEDLPRIRQENIFSIWKNEETGACIDLVPAGIYSDFPAYRKKIIDFNWYEFYETLDGKRYIEFCFKPELEKLGYDFIFIDSRTGLSDYQNICNIQLADANVLVIAPNMQNLEGCVEVGKSIINSPYVQAGKRKPLVFPVLSRAEVDSPDYIDYFEGYKEKTNFLLENLKLAFINLKDKISKDYYNDTLLHYNRYIAIGEHLLFNKKYKENSHFSGRFEEKYINIANYILYGNFLSKKYHNNDFIKSVSIISFEIPSNFILFNFEKEILSIQYKFMENNNIKLEIFPHISEETLLKNIKSMQADILHIISHGSDTGLVISNLNKERVYIDKSYFEKMLFLLDKKPHTIFFNTQVTEEIIAEAKKYIEYIIYSPIPLKDDIAIHFSETFYRHIAKGGNIEDAFNIAKIETEMNLHDFPYILIKKQNSDSLIKHN